MKINRSAKVQNSKVLLAFFFLVFLSCALLFVHSYKKLNAAIQDERVKSVQQLGALISDKVTMLRNNYTQETEQLANILMNASITDMSQVQKLFSGNGNVLLVTGAGDFITADGRRLLIEDKDLRRNLTEKSGVLSSFATVQTLGDYWLFSVSIDGVVIGEVPIVGLIKMVDAKEYADVATIALYDGQGASYVVNGEGLILMRPKTTAANTVFDGYNLFHILEKQNVSSKEIAQLQEAVQCESTHQFVFDIGEIKWLIQSIPCDPGRSIVITVPLSVTAHETYSGMRNVIILIIIMVLSLSALVLSSLVLVMKKSQAVALNEAKTKAKNDFLDKMSHDIRTPLNAIIGMHELALSSLNNTEFLKDCLKKAKMSSEYLVSIINDVLDMSKIESGKMTIASRQFSMSELLNHVMQMEILPASEKGVDLTMEVKTPIHTDFIGDPVRVRQCLINLISNAIKFTPKGGRIKLLYESEESGSNTLLVTLTVQDTGIGMSPDFLDRIFMPFEQEYSSLTSTYVGSGLGLSIVSNLVELMNGKITVDSCEGKGSTFIMKIPFPVTETLEVSGPSDPDDRILERIKGKRVLFVEDNELNREIGILTLEGLGLAVDTAENGQAAVEKIETSPQGYYDIILMDIQMPVMNGLEATARIRGSDHPDGRTIPIIALSANAFEEDNQRSLSAGMQAHLAKPIDLIELKKVLVKFIG